MYEPKKEKEKSNTYKVKNERFAAPNEYLAKKDEESDKGFCKHKISQLQKIKQLKRNMVCK